MTMLKFYVMCVGVLQLLQLKVTECLKHTVIFSCMLVCAEENKTEIVRLGALQPLIRLTKSRDIRVKRNSSGALLNLSHIGK